MGEVGATMKKTVLGAIAAALFCGYVGSYLALSRFGAAEARDQCTDGFFYVTPTSDAGFTTHVFLSFVYAPLNHFERAIGTFAMSPGLCGNFTLGK